MRTGWIIRLAVQAAVPALAKLCAKGIAKGGKSVFKFRGKDYDVKLDKPLKPKNDRKPSEKPEKRPSRTKDCKNPGNKRFAKRALAPKTETKTITRQPTEVVTTRTCDYNVAGQACLHYSSVMSREKSLSSMTCIDQRHIGLGNIRERVAAYNREHHTSWMKGWLQRPNLSCQRDEFPPAAIWQARDKRVWIRLLPGTLNGSAGQLFKGCPGKVKLSTLGENRGPPVKVGCRDRVVVTETVQPIDTVIVIKFKNMPAIDDAGLMENPCWPSTLVDDPGFALNANDPWYQESPNRGRRVYKKYYPNPPEAQFTQGKVNKPGWGKRDEHGVMMGMMDPNDVYVDEGNSSRRITEEEPLDDFGMLRCSGDCSAEMADLGIASLPVSQIAPTPTPQSVEVETTPAFARRATSTVLSKVLDVIISTATVAVGAMITEMAEYAAPDDTKHGWETDLAIW